MLISENLLKAFNEQVGSELGASNQYLKIATYFADEAMPVAAEFFFRQSEEEREHALKFVDYITDAGGNLEIPAIDAPPKQIASPEEAVKLALDWEMEVTDQIRNLVAIALKEEDHMAREFLGWFLDEQMEEVNTMDDLLKVCRRSGDNYHYIEQYLKDLGDPHEE